LDKVNGIFKKINIRKITIAAVAVLFLACLLLPGIYILSHRGHECGHRHEHHTQLCTACIRIEKFQNLLGGGLASSNSWAAGIQFFLLTLVFFAGLYITVKTLITLNIRMNN